MDPNTREHVNEDGSVEYAIDWDTFSFEGELQRRKQVLEEQWSAYTALAESKSDKNYEREQANENVSKIAELQTKNETILSECDALVAEYKKIKENVEKLIVKNNSLKKAIKEQEEEQANSLKEYEQLKTALLAGVKMYTTCFDIDVTVNNLSDTTYEALIQFGKGTDEAPIKFVVDRTERKVLSFDVSEVLLPTEAEDIRKKFGDLHNLPALFHALREIILSKQHNAN